MTDHRVILGDVRLHVVEQGEGPVVLLIHGFPDQSQSGPHNRMPFEEPQSGTQAARSRGRPIP